MPAERRRRGDLAEEAARARLERAGLREIARNVSYRGGELDLVMLDPAGAPGGMLVFVEVRHRADATHGGGAGSVDARKRRKLVLAATLFLQAQPRLATLPCRFDVVAASGDPAKPDLQWIPDAFRADE